MQQQKHTGLEALDKMRQGVTYRKTIKVRDFAFLARPLAISEQAEITNETSERILALPKHAQNRISEEVIFSKLCLVRASTSDFGSRDEKLTEALLDRMTTGEVMALYKEWNAFVESVDPSVEELTPAQLDELIAEAKKNPSRLTECSRSELKQICQHLLGATSVA